MQNSPVVTGICTVNNIIQSFGIIVAIRFLRLCVYPSSMNLHPQWSIIKTHSFNEICVIDDIHSIISHPNEFLNIEGEFKIMSVLISSQS